MMADFSVDAAAFIQQMDAEGVRLMAWQRNLAEMILEGREPVLSLNRPSGKRQAHVMMCALAEMQNKRWEVIGYDRDAERSIRREARELAARLSNG